jgi:hypothetical protein
MGVYSDIARDLLKKLKRLQKVLENPGTDRSKISKVLAQIETTLASTINRYKKEARVQLPYYSRLIIKVPRISEMDGELAKLKKQKNNRNIEIAKKKENKNSQSQKAVLLNTIEKLKNRVGNPNSNVPVNNVKPVMSRTTRALNTLSRLKNTPNYNKINNVNVKALLNTKNVSNLSSFNNARLNRINNIIKSKKNNLIL